MRSVMRKLLLIAVDLAILSLSIVVAWFLRENFVLSSDRVDAMLVYGACTLVAGVAVIVISGMSYRVIWRLTRLDNYLRLAIQMAAIVLFAVALTFAYNRMEGVPRSIPALHFIIGTALLIGARVGARVRHVRRQLAKRKFATFAISGEEVQHSVVLVGYSALTEAYLESAAQLSKGRVKVVGVLGLRQSQVGRRAGDCEILGLPEQIVEVLEALELHGQKIDRIVVTVDAEALSDRARQALSHVGAGGNIRVQFLAEDLGFTGPRAVPPAKTLDDQARPGGDASIETRQLADLAARPYFRVKRIVEAGLAAVLLVVLSPVLVVLSLFIAMFISPSVFFWQERPGLKGVPIRLWKFCSMRPLRDAAGRRRSDEHRTTGFGRFLRASRLDELPQLLNVCRGDMAFVGPRPLLPRDQSDVLVARLLLRPGLTGWAQVVGGREISAADKAALDVWYLRNASLRLDFEIMVRTAHLVIFGERTYNELIVKAWRELLRDGVLKGQLVALAQQRVLALT